MSDWLSDLAYCVAFIASTVSRYLLCADIGQHLSAELATCNNIRQQSRDDTVLDGGSSIAPLLTTYLLISFHEVCSTLV